MFNNPILNEIITKYHENKLAHAYLIETNNSQEFIHDLLKLIKNINCPHTYKEECSKCNLCNLTNKNNLPSIKFIEPDGTSIKKNQIEELQIAFSSKPLFSKYNIYIILNAEKLNASSANAMLKFLEEPLDNILGFFITNNKDIIMETIKSRCQMYVINYPNEDIIKKLGLTPDEYQKYLDLIINYLKLIKIEKPINNKKEILDIYSERKDIEILFKIMFYLYYQNYLYLIDSSYDNHALNQFKITNNILQIVNEMNIIEAILLDLSYNVNIELILDKFVIEMRRTNG